MLLENFSEASSAEKLRTLNDKVEVIKAKKACALDPLMQVLSHYDSDENLSRRIATLFQVIDVDDSGTLSYAEMFEGLKKMQFSPSIYLSRVKLHPTSYTLQCEPL